MGVIEHDWLSDRLVEALRWRLANPGREDGPEIPWAGLRIWSLFLRLHECRANGGFGPTPISYEAMMAYRAMTSEPLRSWEIEIIRAMDREWLKTAEKSEPSTNLQKVSSRPMSPALFDATFASS